MYDVSGSGWCDGMEVYLLRFVPTRQHGADFKALMYDVSGSRWRDGMEVYLLRRVPTRQHGVDFASRGGITDAKIRLPALLDPATIL